MEPILIDYLFEITYVNDTFSITLIKLTMVWLRTAEDTLLPWPPEKMALGHLLCQGKSDSWVLARPQWIDSPHRTNWLIQGERRIWLMFLHGFVVIRKIITKGARGKVGTWRENRVRDLQFFIHTRYMLVRCTGQRICIHLYNDAHVLWFRQTY